MSGEDGSGALEVRRVDEMQGLSAGTHLFRQPGRDGYRRHQVIGDIQVPVPHDGFDLAFAGVVDDIVADGGVAGGPVEEDPVGEGPAGFAAGQLFVSPDIVEMIVEDEVGCGEPVHGGEMDGRPVDGGLHAVMDLIEFDHMSALVSEGEDAVA